MHGTVKFPIVSFVVGFVLVSRIIIIITVSL